MALRILEKNIMSLSPWGDETTDLALTAQVAYIDTSQPPGEQVIEEYTPVRIPLTVSTITGMELARSQAYRARCIELFGAAPITAILLHLVSV